MRVPNSRSMKFSTVTRFCSDRMAPSTRFCCSRNSPPTGWTGGTAAASAGGAACGATRSTTTARGRDGCRAGTHPSPWGWRCVPGHGTVARRTCDRGRGFAQGHNGANSREQSEINCSCFPQTIARSMTPRPCACGELAGLRRSIRRDFPDPPSAPSNYSHVTYIVVS